MAHSPDIYNLLTGVKIDDATIVQLDAATKESFINKDNAEFWRGPIFISKVMEAGRTYPHGLPVPESGAIVVETIPNGELGTIQPSGTEVWLIQAVATDNCAIFLSDGSNVVDISSTAEYIGRTRNPMYITNSLYIVLQNASGSEQTPAVAYHKVSL
jgi:hypothetical protein